MTDRAELTTVEHVYENGSHLCTVTDEFDLEDEVIVVPCDEPDDAISEGAAFEDGDDGRRRGVTAWINRCTHEAQRFDTGQGVPMRENQIVCPRHGSMFDACSGDCDNGEAADSTLPAVEVTVHDGIVYLTDDSYTFAHDGGIDEGDGPSSTSHVGF